MSETRDYALHEGSAAQELEITSQLIKASETFDTSWRDLHDTMVRIPCSEGTVRQLQLTADRSAEILTVVLKLLEELLNDIQNNADGYGISSVLPNLNEAFEQHFIEFLKLVLNLTQVTTPIGRTIEQSTREEITMLSQSLLEAAVPVLECVALVARFHNEDDTLTREVITFLNEWAMARFDTRATEQSVDHAQSHPAAERVHSTKRAQSHPAVARVHSTERAQSHPAVARVHSTEQVGRSRRATLKKATPAKRDDQTSTRQPTHSSGGHSFDRETLAEAKGLSDEQVRAIVERSTFDPEPAYALLAAGRIWLDFSQTEIVGG